LDLPASIAITGASGFIGSHLVNRLRGEGIEPVLLTRSAGFDICEVDSLASAPPVDAVVHLAGRTFVPASHQDVNGFMQTNVTGTLNSLEFCRQRNARFVFLSSYVYGRPERLPVDETHPTGHWNPYAASKLVGEELCHAFADCFGVCGVILRLFNAYGPGQSNHFLIPKIVSGARSGEISLHSSKPKRDYVHVTDAVDAIVRSLSCRDGLRTFNVGSGVSHSVREIVDIIVDSMSPTNPPISVSYSEQERANEVMDVVANWGLIHRELGWEPTIPLQTGLTQLALSDE
jgi:GDP-4-dehydro-6-deoxy-D-mannose reductase